MLMYPMYHVVFFDVDLPKTALNALNKRIDRNKWINIVDGIIEKTIELKVGEKTSMYKVVSVSTFNILNTVDNTFFAVCDVKKITQDKNYITTKI